MCDVVLFFPRFTSDNHETRLLPASLLMVAAPLAQAGYQVRIIDQRVDNQWADTLRRALDEKPLVVGFSALTGQQILHGLEASRIVKEHGQTVTVWGGVHASLLPEQTLANPYVDLVAIGEGEQTFFELVEKLKRGNSYKEIAGLGYQETGRIVCNPERPFLDMDKLAPLPYHLVNVENYIAARSFATGRTGRSIALYTSRGCPHRCGFCYNLKFNRRKWRGKSAQKVVAEMEELIDRYNITSFEIEDDEFFTDLKRAREISQLIIDKQWKVDIFTSCRVNYAADLMDDSLIRLLAQAGFKKLSFGVESGSERIQRLIDKDINNAQVIKTVRRMTAAGITSKFYFMCGFPGESLADLRTTCGLMREIKRCYRGALIPGWRLFVPYPGTTLYDQAVRYGFRPPASLAEWARYDFETVRMPWLFSKQRKLIDTIPYMLRFLELPPAKRRSWYLRLGRWYGKTIDWRWRHRWFAAPERKLVDFIRRLHRNI